MSHPHLDNRASSPLLSVMALILLAAIFVLDLKAPMGLEGGIPYAAVAVFSYWANKPSFGHWVMVLSTVLILGAPFAGNLTDAPSYLSVDRLYAVANLCIVALPFYLVRKFLGKKYTIELAEIERRNLRAQAKLRISEDRYRDFAESSSDGRWEINENLVYNYLSENYLFNTGFARELVLGTGRKELIATENTPDEVAKHMKDLQARRPFHDFRYKTVNSVKGERFWSENGKPIFDDQGAFKGYRGSSKDISALIVAEAKTKDTILQFRSAIEHLTDGFLLVDSDHRVVICNNQMLEFNADIADLIVPGASYLEIGQARKERGQVPFEGQTVSDLLYGSESAANRETDSFLRKHNDGRRVLVNFL